MKDDLTLLSNRYGTDKGTTFIDGTPHGYTEHYHTHFNDIRDVELNLLEIGVVMPNTTGGQSLQVWKEYFKNANIYAMDILNIERFNDERVKTYSGDQGNRNCLREMTDTFRVKFDIIIDDGSHKQQDQLISLGYLINHLNSGGIYIIEDITIPNISTKMGFRNDATYQFLSTKSHIPHGYLTQYEEYNILTSIDYIQIYPDMNNEFAMCMIKKK